MISFSSFILESSSNIVFSFSKNGKDYSISGKSKKEIYCKVLDWLFNNGYDFSKEKLQKSILSLDDVKSITSKTNYRKDHFYNISGSNNFIKILSPGTGYLNKGGMIYKILSEFGCDGLKFSSDFNITSESKTKMTFIEAAQNVLKQNGNKPMSAFEIWEQSEDLVETKGKTPWDSMNAQMILYSENTTAKGKKKNSLFKIVEGTRPYKFQLIYPEKEVESIPDESEKYFLLGAYNKENPDWWKQCVEEGKWYNGFALDGDTRLNDKVNEIPVGSNVAIKSTYTKERVKPAMMIKARGIVTKNYGDGTQLDVDWEKDFTPFEIVRNDVGGYRTTLHEVDNQDHIDLIWGEESDVDFELTPKSKAFDYPDDDVLQFSHFIGVQAQPEVGSKKDFIKNPFRQAICVLGKSGKGKSTTVEKILDNYPNMEYEFIIPTASTTNLLSQYSPSKGYIQSRLGKLIMKAHDNPKKLYTAVFDECHKSNVIEMINDELLQCISLYRNMGKRFISVDYETASLYDGLEMDRSGNLLLPDNIGFIFLSSKPDVIIQNSDFFNRVDIYILTNQPRDKNVTFDDIEYFTQIGSKETGHKTKNNIDEINEIFKDDAE